MNKNIFLSSMLCGLCFASFAASVNAKSDTDYNAQKYQQVCKGKSQGTPVTFAYRAVIWNGTCETQFFPSSKNASIRGDEPELYSTCSNGDNKATTANINGSEMKGKCALGYMPPRPSQSQMQMQQSQPQMQSQPEMRTQPQMQSQPEMQPQ
ncbi:hypothetical protein LZZ98_02395 [Acinetobacter sp. SM34]|uniref:hypothetical protein n=1 Tax=Acinetobacter sp. SM34 TaxID=1301620 RepID=UPI001EDA19C8|nr:hypothetical protein [Acinetobacter sp. SM34]MCG2607414.1 hypothetical protein [Acinetobacter sp. SM34]